MKIDIIIPCLKMRKLRLIEMIFQKCHSQHEVILEFKSTSSAMFRILLLTCMLKLCPQFLWLYVLISRSPLCTLETISFQTTENTWLSLFSTLMTILLFISPQAPEHCGLAPCPSPGHP